MAFPLHAVSAYLNNVDRRRYRNQGGRAFTPDFWAKADAAPGGDGRTEATAFSTLSALQTAATAFGAGVKIGLLASAAPFRGDLILSATSRVDLRGMGDIATYGLPLVCGSKSLAGTWQTNTDRADIYDKVYSISFAQTVAEGYVSIWRNGVKPVWVTSLALAQATANTFYIPNDGTGSNKTGPGAHTIYYHAPGDANPNSDGATYEITDYDRLGCIELGDDSTMELVHTRRNMRADGSLVMRKRATARRCIAEDGVKHEALLTSGIYDRCVGWHQHDDPRTNHIGLEFYAGDGTGLYCETVKSIAVGPGTTSTQVTVGFSGHNQGAGTYYEGWNNTDCSAANLHQGFSGGGKADAYDIRCFTKNCRQQFTDRLSISGMYYNTDCYISSNDYRGQGGFTRSAEIDGLRAYFSTNSNSAQLLYGATSVINIRRSVIVDDRPEFVPVHYATPRASADGVVYDNRAANRRMEAMNGISAAAIAASTRKNNVYSENPGQIASTVNSTSYLTATALLAAYPETGSIVAVAGVVDPANGNFNCSNPAVAAAGAGLERPNITYTPIPADLAAAKSWVIAA